MLERILFVISVLTAAAVLAVVLPFVWLFAGITGGISRFTAALRRGHGGTMTIQEGV